MHENRGFDEAKAGEAPVKRELEWEWFWNDEKLRSYRLNSVVLMFHEHFETGIQRCGVICRW